MIDLVRFFFNPFDDERISQAEIETFTIHHIAAMVANNGAGTFSTLITQTTNLSTTFDQSLSSKVVLLGVQKARVQAKDLFRQNLAEELGKIYGMVTGRFGKKGIKTTEIFPGGLSLYSDCEDALLGTNLEALHTALTANVAELGSDPINLADTQKSQWASIFNDASTGKAGSTPAAPPCATQTKPCATNSIKTSTNARVSSPATKPKPSSSSRNTT